MNPSPMPIFFKAAAAFGAWLAKPSVLKPASAGLPSSWRVRRMVSACEAMGLI